MSYAAVIIASLGSTGFFALATALKHRSASQMPHLNRFRAGALLRFVGATARHPLWLGGLLADVGGLGLQVLALDIGSLAVVQPLLVSSLLFSVVVNHRIAGTRISGRELVSGTLLVASVGGFLVSSGALTAGSRPQAADHAPAVVAAATAVVVAVACVVISRRMTSGTAAALMGIAVGTTYAGTAALIKACTNLLHDGALALLGSWQLYVLLVAGATGLVLAQLAFQAGPLTASLPATSTIDPLLSVVLGVAVYDERLRGGAGPIFLELLCLLVMSAAVVVLSRVRATAEATPHLPVVETDGPQPSRRGP